MICWKRKKMTKVDAHPDDLRRFIIELEQFNKILYASLPPLERQFAHAGDTWRDSENMRYALEFQQTMKTLHNFIRVTEAEIASLKRKLATIDNYYAEGGF